MIRHDKPLLALAISLTSLTTGWVFGAVGCATTSVNTSAAAPAMAKQDTAKVVPVVHANQSLPNPGMAVDLEHTALVVTDPQNDFLSPNGVAWGVVEASVQEHHTVENLQRLFSTAKAKKLPVFVSPHYYYPTDHGWKFEGALERLMHDIDMFERAGPLNLDHFNGSGADWLALYKPFIEDGETVVTSPHKVYGPDSNDLVLQLRKRGIDRVILAGMSANLCLESHMRELIEQGFEVVVVSDATAAAVIPDGDGYAAAMTNFRFISSGVLTTNEIVAVLDPL
jgi:nicotinamidase-related amidase